MQIKDKLFAAFHEDHAALGKALWSMGTFLADGDIKAARKTADHIDQDAGAHIAFEEQDFYPMLEAYLSRQDVQTMYREHAEGLAIIRNIAEADDGELSDPLIAASFLMRIEELEKHVSDCGDLFGAMGALSDEQYDKLFKRLTYWRRQTPRWSDISEPAILKTSP